MRLLPAALLIGTLLAGCSQSDPGPMLEDPDTVLDDPDAFYASHYCVKNNVEPRALAPDASGRPWRLGDWWEYSLEIDGEKLPPTRLIYYADQDFAGDVPQHYMVGTPTREEALQHALFSTNPAIGRVHRLLYSPHEQGSHADMFHFPLCDGSTWTPSTQYFGELYAFEARQTALSIPGGNDPDGYRITGTSNEGGSAVHTYSPAAKWFTMIDVTSADGSTVRMGMTDAGSGATGDAFFLRGQQDEVIDLATMPRTFTVERAAGGAGAYDTVGIYMDVSRAGDQRVEVFIDAPSGTLSQCVGVNGTALLSGGTACSKEPIMFEVPFEEGDWRVRLAWSGVGRPPIEGEVRFVSIYDRSCEVGAPDCAN